MNFISTKHYFFFRNIFTYVKGTWWNFRFLYECKKNSLIIFFATIYPNTPPTHYDQNAFLFRSWQMWKESFFDTSCQLFYNNINLMHNFLQLLVLLVIILRPGISFCSFHFKCFLCLVCFCPLLTLGLVSKWLSLTEYKNQNFGADE